MAVLTMAGAAEEQVRATVQSFIAGHYDMGEQALDWNLVSRHLERVGVHATNIVEDAILIASGLDVRYYGQEGQSTK